VETRFIKTIDKPARTGDNGRMTSPPILITQPEQLTTMLRRMMAAPVVGVDTESNSLYVYREKVCLIQFSVPGADYVVDPLAPGLDIAPLGKLFADARVVKVFHAAEYDVMCLKRDAGFQFRNLFDTMWAARVLGWKQVGLAAILEGHFGVRVDKHWQRYNWGRRPLERAALTYARLDSHYLPGLREIQMRELLERGRDEEAREVFDQVAGVEPASRQFRADDFWHIKGAWDLTSRSQAVLRELFIYREREAQRRDWPPFKIMGDKTLLALAQARPRCVDNLVHLDGMTPAQISRYGEGVVNAVTRGMSASIPRPPRSSPPDYGVLARYERLRTWRKRVAAERGVDPDVVVSNSALMAVAQRVPHTPKELEGVEGLGPWRLKTYGEQLVEVLR
jgi:ribonuclease D